MEDFRSYHRCELQIARAPDDPRHIMPPIAERHRHILDVGCGAGQTLIASGLAPSVFAVGVDIDRGALELGRQLAPDLPFACARGEALPFADATFDLVVSRVALPYMPIARTLAEIRRVLRAGGELWAALHPFGMTVGALAEDIRQLRLRALVQDLYVTINGVALHVSGREFPLPFRRRYESFQTESGMRRILRRAGFERIEIDRSRSFVVTARKA
jgi:SAM-dependent methyltransferase